MKLTRELRRLRGALSRLVAASREVVAAEREAERAARRKTAKDAFAKAQRETAGREAGEQEGEPDEK